ncbi:MAG TPA: tetraacyldisaccharide 4'-kinase [Parafilimonas sp.]|nr:tetraacyldisaccharide 4'-kinase [Parafilimonas sp.]
MNFNSAFLRSFRILLFPFSLLYGLAIIIRNFLYDIKILRSAEFNLPIICVGNLALGGTGKSPMVEYLVDLLHKKFRVATISRGYKRKTKGYALANDNSTALEIGDEPMQFHVKFPGVPVAVGEERVVAIPQLLHDRPDTEAIILDDAFQHRAIKAGLNILLTEYSDLFVDDFFFPTGDLRDQKASSKRAHIIVVTKCDPAITAEERQKITSQLNLKDNQAIFFTKIAYGTPYHIMDRNARNILTGDEILLVYGIANPRPLKQYISERTAAYEEISFGDHHIFSIDDLREMNKRFQSLKTSNKFIVTTEKDAVRLLKFREQLNNMPLYVLPVRHDFLFNEGEHFNQAVIAFIENFKKRMQNEKEEI